MSVSTDNGHRGLDQETMLNIYTVYSAQQLVKKKKKVHSDFLCAVLKICRSTLSLLLYSVNRMKVFVGCTIPDLNPQFKILIKESELRLVLKRVAHFVKS